MRALLMSLLALGLAGSGCSCSDDPGTTPDGGTGGPDGTVIRPDGWLEDGPFVIRDGGTIITEDGGGTWTCYQILCAGHLTECGDCEDNDGDGFVDWHDPECLGPCDNTEGPIFLTGVGGETGGPCKADCYFDYGNGSGNDQCYWDHRCDPLSVAPTYDPEGMGCAFEMSRVGTRDCPAEQNETCNNICPALTPNGCDCFGCCTFPEIADRPAAEGGNHVWLGSVVEGTNDGTCTFDDILDTTLCRPCTPVSGECYNPCGPCEVCIGRPMPPPSCYPPPDGGTYPDGGYPDAGMPYYRCETGVQECGLPGDTPCPLDYYCVTGCCRPTLI